MCAWDLGYPCGVSMAEPVRSKSTLVPPVQIEVSLIDPVRFGEENTSMA